MKPICEDQVCIVLEIKKGIWACEASASKRAEEKAAQLLDVNVQ
jgi:hypothetical protein